MTLNIFSTKDCIVNRVRKSRKLRGVIGKMNPKIVDLAFPRNGKAKIAKRRLKLGGERGWESRSTGPRDKNRKLRRRVKFTDPFGKR